MQTKVLRITNLTKSEMQLKEAARILREGGLVVFPTETVYGLGGNGLSAESSEKIYAAKGRPSNNPLIIHIHDPAEADRYARTGDLYFRLAAAFMPGPLTVILPKRNCVPYATTGGLDTVAIRCPDHPVAHALLTECDFPVAAPSANLSGSPSPTCADHVISDLTGRVDMIIDGGECDIGLESTVIKITETGCIILRPGAVTEEMLSEVCTSVSVAKAVVEPGIAAEEKVESPGMKYKHYSPKADVILVDADGEEFVAYVNNNSDNNCGVFTSGDERTKFTSARTLITGEHSGARDESKSLFRLLRKADEMGLAKVYIKLPEAKGEYLALYNRLIRAAGGKIVKP